MHERTDIMEKIKNFNRLNDYFFKNLMGQDERKSLALDFLNSIVELEDNMVSVRW